MKELTPDLYDCLCAIETAVKPLYDNGTLENGVDTIIVSDNEVKIVNSWCNHTFSKKRNLDGFALTRKEEINAKNYL